jgi:hypothetical protein
VVNERKTAHKRVVGGDGKCINISFFIAQDKSDVKGFFVAVNSTVENEKMGNLLLLFQHCLDKLH